MGHVVAIVVVRRAWKIGHYLNTKIDDVTAAQSNTKISDVMHDQGDQHDEREFMISGAVGQATFFISPRTSEKNSRPVRSDLRVARPARRSGARGRSDP